MGRLFSVLVVAIVSVLFIGCSDNGSGSSSNRDRALLGVWQEFHEENGEHAGMYLVLTSDGFGVDYWVNGTVSCEIWRWHTEDGRIFTTGEKGRLRYQISGDTLRLLGWGSYIMIGGLPFDASELVCFDDW